MIMIMNGNHKSFWLAMIFRGGCCQGSPVRPNVPCSCACSCCCTNCCACCRCC
ncbi:hypothetical protein ACFW04_006236 [Cataglyphis niger]